MQHALQNVPIMELSPPEGLSHEGGDWAYSEYSRGAGVSSLGLESSPRAQEMPANDEKKRILDLFRN